MTADEVRLAVIKLAIQWCKAEIAELEGNENDPQLLRLYMADPGGEALVLRLLNGLFGLFGRERLG